MKQEELFQEILLLAGKRRRVGGLDLLNVLLQREGHFSVSEARQLLAETLQELKGMGRVDLPTGKRLWDYGGRVPLPKWITVVHERPSIPTWNHINHPWHPKLGFVADFASLVNAEDVIAIDHWLRAVSEDEPFIPVKERSWEIFGKEKKLEALVATKLFAAGRLTLDILRCYVVAHIPVHRIFDNDTATLIISENEAGFDSLCRAANEFGAFRCVVFGNGLAVEKSVEFLGRSIDEYKIDRCIYVGDVDAAGLEIPKRLNDALILTASVSVTPWLPAYEHMLAGVGACALVGHDLANWLPADLEHRARSLVREGKRIAQESVGWKQIAKMFAR